MNSGKFLDTVTGRFVYHYSRGKPRKFEYLSTGAVIIVCPDS